MSVITVLGAGGTVFVPFNSAMNTQFAQQLAGQISNAVTAGTLAQAALNDLRYMTTGATEAVVGGVTSVGGALGGATLGLAPNYVAMVNNASDPVTVAASANAIAPLSILGGTGGTTFLSDNSTVGGLIALGGGVNSIAGTRAVTGDVDSNNGGIAGNWTIGTGSPTGTDYIFLATGTDSVSIGSSDTVNAGGAVVTATVTGTGTGTPVFFIGSQNSTVTGGTAANLQILGNDTATGGGVYTLGSGGNGRIAAGAGATTLIGGGSGDILFASSVAGSQDVFHAGAGNETLQAGGEGGNSTLYGGSGPDVISGGKGNDQIYAGSGSDTIYTSLGNDTVFFATATTGGAVADTIVDFNPALGTLALSGYGTASGSAYAVTSAGSAPLTLTLSDKSTITFSNLTSAAASSLNIKLS